MSVQESSEETYKRIKKRLRDYKYRSAFLTWGALAFVVLFILSLVPIFPAIIISSLGLPSTDWFMVLWVSCAVVFGVLFWLFQNLAGKIEAKRGIILEEKMFVPAYEASRFLQEYFVSSHPVLSSKLKAIRKLQSIDYVLESAEFPYASIIGEEAAQMWRLRQNLKHKLIPSIGSLTLGDVKSIQDVCLAVTEFVDYVSRPSLPRLVALNGMMASLPVVTKKGMLEDFAGVILRRSNLRHTVVLSFCGALAWLVAYLDISYYGATSSAALEFGMMFLVGIVATYVAYLAITTRREPKREAPA